MNVRVPSEGDPHHMAARVNFRLYDAADDNPPFRTVIGAFAREEELDDLILE